MFIFEEDLELAEKEIEARFQDWLEEWEEYVGGEDDNLRRDPSKLGGLQRLGMDERMGC